MNSALIGFGAVWHRRLRPVEHAFSYRSFFLLLPLRSLRQQPCPALNRNRWGWLSFQDRDHGRGGDDALAWFEQLLRSEGITDADGEVWLQTFPRVLGYVFKPVSFWYAHRADGSLAAVLAEVNNTFGETQHYLLSAPGQGVIDEHTRLVCNKLMHVSPFCEVSGFYRFRFRDQARHEDAGGNTAFVGIDYYDHGHPSEVAQGLQPLMRTSVGGHLHPLTAATAFGALCAQPFLTLGVVARIHWQALLLWRKRVPWFSKPERVAAAGPSSGKETLS